ncbi:hypothetical protein BBJ28_00005904 [Nothophytophthora sp. Chile5]|nr:hypothetical protein BBJ28_00005904 [Nothophytophthora sp. Chile5]
MGCVDCLGKCISELILIAINIILALGGALVLYVAIYIRHTGWVEVIKAYWSPIDPMVTALIAVGGVVIGLAVLGSIAALFRWRAGLCIYAIIVLIVLLVFIAVAVCSFLLWSMFSGWEDKTYPANSNEESIKEDFDQVYCYAQGVYICDEASVADALTMFVPDLDSAIIALFENMTGGVNALCDDYLSDYDTLSDVCSGCDTAQQLENYTSVLDWANDECPRTDETLVWCGQFFLDGSASNITSGTAPYTQCRTEFLDLVSNYSLYLAIGSVIIAVGAIAVIIMSCYLRRQEMRDSYASY